MVLVPLSASGALPVGAASTPKVDTGLNVLKGAVHNPQTPGMTTVRSGWYAGVNGIDNLANSQNLSTASTLGPLVTNTTTAATAAVASAPYDDESNVNHPQGSNKIWTCPDGGTCDNTDVNIYNSNEYDGCGWWSCDISFDGNFNGAWMGCCPYNASSMTLSSNWHVDGCGISFSVGGGGGSAGISGSGSDAYWNGSVNNNWRISDSYNGVHFSTYCGYWNITQTVTTNAAFGGGAQNFTTSVTWDD